MSPGTIDASCDCQGCLVYLRARDRPEYYNYNYIYFFISLQTPDCGSPRVLRDAPVRADHADCLESSVDGRCNREVYRWCQVEQEQHVEGTTRYIQCSGELSQVGVTT